jgi:hypothetical protein
MPAVLEDVRAAIRGRVLPAEPRAEARAAAARVVAGGGDSVRAVIFFGSRRTRAAPDPWSAYDFFVLTASYGTFYRSLRQAGLLRRSPLVVAALNAWLPPNQISIRGRDQNDTPLHAKCAVIRLDTLGRETSRARRDHFCLGRLFQPTEIVYAADGAAREAVLDALVSAHVLTLKWVRPWLPAQFDVDTYCRTLLRVSLAQEIRPEPSGRADALWEAQREELAPVYAVVLRALAAAGELRQGADGSFALVRPASLAERIAVTVYFRLSLVRATLRWAKYMFTFEDWLDYILRKARRHTGEEIVLSERERRLPLIFLWPRVFRYLRHKNVRRVS